MPTFSPVYLVLGLGQDPKVAVGRAVEEFAKVGLKVNAAKSVVWSRGSERAVAVLGIPILAGKELSVY